MSPTTSRCLLSAWLVHSRCAGGRPRCPGPAQSRSEHQERPLPRRALVVAELTVGTQRQRPMGRRGRVATSRWSASRRRPASSTGSAGPSRMPVSWPFNQWSYQASASTCRLSQGQVSPYSPSSPTRTTGCVGQVVQGGERRREVQRDVLPVAAQVGRHLHPVEQRAQVALVPPVVAQGVLDGDRPPQVVPGVGVVVELECGVQHRDRRLAVHRGELAGAAAAVRRTVAPASISSLRQNRSLRAEVSPTMARNGVTKPALKSPWWIAAS